MANSFGTARCGRQVRAQTFRPRLDLDMLFIAVDIEQGRIMHAWLIPSPAFAELAGNPNSRGRLRFSASMQPGTRDKWIFYRLTAAELAPRILTRLADLNEAA